MPGIITDAVANDMLDDLGTLVTHLSLHSADPGTNGASELSGGTYARVAATWSAAAARSKGLNGTHTFNVPAGATVSYVGMWSASSAGTFRGSWNVTDEVYAGAGTYDFTSGTVSI